MLSFNLCSVKYMIDNKNRISGLMKIRLKYLDEHGFRIYNARILLNTMQNYMKLACGIIKSLVCIGVWLY